jgi:integrase
LVEDMARLAKTTQADRRKHLAESGPLVREFGERKLDEITCGTLREWWGREIEARGRSVATGRHLVSTVAAVFGYARDLGLIERSPVAEFREMLRRHTRTKRGRAEGVVGRDVRPIERPEELARILAAALDQGPLSHTLVLFMLDAGLRLGEAVAVTWQQIAWGADADDQSRAIIVDRNRPRGGEAESTKSGRERRVALSRRLRRTLSQLYLRQGRPGPEVPVLGRLDPNNFRNREWRRICERARVGSRRMKDLRDTFASWLLSLGAPIPLVQEALGHSDWATTARHYGKWIPLAGHHPPLTLEPGEVWPDLLARIPEERPQSDPTRLPTALTARDSTE